MYKKKFKIGKQIKTVNEAVNEIWNKKSFIFYLRKPLHYGWTSSWSLMTIHRFITSNKLFKAKEIKKCQTN